MHDELKTRTTDFRGQLAEMQGYLDIDVKRGELDRLERVAAAPEFWNDQARAQANIAATKSLKMVLDPFEAIVSALSDAEVMLELAEAGEEDALVEASAELDKVKEGFQALELQSLLGGEFDGNGASSESRSSLRKAVHRSSGIGVFRASRLSSIRWGLLQPRTRELIAGWARPNWSAAAFRGTS